jgi:SepF-like predicted cell division protein (DUF552 family)
MAFWENQRVQNYDSLDSLNALDLPHEMQKVGVKNFVIAAPFTKKSDCLRVSQELEQGNILILDVQELVRESVELNALVFELKNVLEQKGGEMARISPNRILVVPTHFKIVKKNL